MKTILLSTYVISLSEVLYWILPFYIILLIICNIYYKSQSNRYKLRKITIFNFFNPFKDICSSENPAYIFMFILSLLIYILYTLSLNTLSKHNFIFTF